MQSTDLPDRPAPARKGQAILALALLGDFLPVATWFYLARRYGDDLAWQEGLGFFVLIFLLIVLFIAEVTAYCLAKKTYRYDPAARGALVVASISLVAVIGFVVLLIAWLTGAIFPGW